MSRPIAISLCLYQISFATFSDVPEKYREAVEYAGKNSIVEGYSDGTFRPNEEISRAEAVKIVVTSKFKDEEIYGGNCFPDVANQWFAKYICTAERNGIVSGYPDGDFHPDRKVSFVEAAKIIANDLSVNETIWYANYVRFLSDHHCIPISVMGFLSELTRGEFIEIIWRYKEDPNMKQSNKIFVEERDSLSTFSDDEIKRFYYRVEEGVFYVGSQAILNIDINSMELLNEEFARDNSKVFHIHERWYG
ncbi:MAG: S-layer homology domain-containing protein, partial [Candidatus Peregrinibacteria bacterium]|nr:S-layer homology domain-containing protein [Candidatus Peregrinibacteria bacterium]